MGRIILGLLEEGGEGNAVVKKEQARFNLMLCTFYVSAK